MKKLRASDLQKFHHFLILYFLFLISYFQSFPKRVSLLFVLPLFLRPKVKKDVQSKIQV